MQREYIPNLQLKIACILDQFSYECFKYEANFLQIEPDTWRQKLITFKPDLLLVESVWEGKNRSWRLRFRSPIDSTLRDIVEWCKRRSIPTLFWNKEDPPNFHLFLNNAKLFDYILTTDENCVPQYNKVLQHDRIFVLPFAAQPIIHNPINCKKEKIGQIAFAGTWHNSKYPERKHNLNMMLKSAMAYDLSIYDRMSQSSEKIYYGFPELFAPYMKEALPYLKLIQAYKQYDVFLNVDSVSDSPTMFSRRVFELLACGTPVVSSYSRGIEDFFPQIVPLCKTEDEWAKSLNQLLADAEYRDRLSLKGQRAVFSQHTYRHRLQEVLRRIGVEHKSVTADVSIISVVTDPQRIRTALDNYERQKHLAKELILLVAVNQKTSANSEKHFQAREDIHLYPITANTSLDRMLHYGMLKANSSYLSIFNEHDYYGPEFISDLLSAIQYTGAAAVGKAAYYTYRPHSDTLILENAGQEYEYNPLINPSAMMLNKEQCESLLFEGLVYQLPQRLSQKDLPIYSVDHFQYVCNFYRTKQTKKAPDTASWEKAVLV